MARFLLASQRRANQQRAARPQTARRMRAWIALGAAAWAALALARQEPFARRAPAFAAWWGLTWLMLDWHIGMLETEDGAPCNLSAADACTLVRVWLVPAAADSPQPWMCALALATDGLDGRLARRYATPTRLGRDLEGLADAAFAIAALRGARRRGWLSRGGGRRRARADRRRAGLQRRCLVRHGAPAGRAPAARRARDDAGARRRPRGGRVAAPPAGRRARRRRRGGQPRRYGCSSPAAAVKSAISQPFVRVKRRSTGSPSIVPVTRAVSGPP